MSSRISDGHKDSGANYSVRCRNLYSNDDTTVNNATNNRNYQTSAYISVRRHSSGNCRGITESCTSDEDFSRVPPPVPARLSKPPIVPQRNPSFHFDAISSASVGHTSSITTFVSAGTDTIVGDRCGLNGPRNERGSCVQDNSTAIIRLPPPPQATNLKRCASINKSSSNKSDIAGLKNSEPGPALANASVSSESRLEITSMSPLQRAVLYKNQQTKLLEDSYFTFPSAPASKFVSTQSEETDKISESNTSHFEETFSLVRKKSGKKVPPPLDYQPEENSPNILNRSGPFKMSASHDSTLSCSDGGVSQTSSPSYMMRSLESPLLPKVKTVSTNRHLKKKFITDRLFPEINQFSSVKDNNSSPDLTKSQSTPAGLQTVIDYQQGSSSPYQHKIVTVRKSSISSSQLKFQFLQIIINVLVLIAVAGALACYFRAFPAVTTVKYINQTITYMHNISNRPIAYFPEYQISNEYGYYCTPFMSRFCMINKVPYNYSMLPNFFGSTSEREAEMELELYDAIVNVRCYQLAPLFLCSLYLPKCGPNGLPVLPCSDLCNEMYARCGLFMDVFGLRLPEKIDCSTFPSSDNADVCIGHAEIVQLKVQEGSVVCNDGFKCDERRCIPADWRCDGHIDCKDETDELNCTQCPGQLHCGMGQCIATSHICDGVLNCPWGQDERNCVRLSDQMGDVGYGDVEIFMPSVKSFRKACVSSWNYRFSPKILCDLLGYRYVNDTKLKNIKGRLDINRFNPQNAFANKLQLFHMLKDCKLNEQHPTLTAVCSTYDCGVRKQSLGLPVKRIVGGVQSNPGDWPFLAAILGGPKEIFYCAGVLISDQWVLSAAHCIGNFNLSRPPKDWTIQLGMTRRFSHSYFAQKIKVLNVIPHPRYNQGIAHDNDIALFQLSERVKFYDHLLPVCMPKGSMILKPPRKCTVIGWGKREDNDNYEPTVYEVEVPILSRTLCNQWLKKRDLNVTPNMICAGYEHGGKDACQGDSGGPLLCQDEEEPNRWFVGGIVSWGIKCAHPHLPGIYANVPTFVKWIEAQMERHS